MPFVLKQENKKKEEMMKKTMLIMAVALIAAVSVQASSLAWGSAAAGYLYQSDGITKAATGSPSAFKMVLVLLPSAGYDVSLDTGVAFAARIKSTTANVITAGVVGATVTGLASANNTEIYQMYGFIGTSYYKIIDVTTSTMVASYTVSGIVSGTEVITSYKPGTALPSDALKYDSTAITFVPEPTSMALLALGAAALGLRRKFRA